MKKPLWPVAIFALGITGMVCSFVMMNRSIDRLERKEKTLGEICLATKVHLDTSVRFLRRDDAPSVDLILNEYDNAQIGNRVRMIDWCTLGSESGRTSSLETLRAITECRSRHDALCVANILENAERGIAQETP